MMERSVRSSQVGSFLVISLCLHFLLVGSLALANSSVKNTLERSLPQGSSYFFGVGGSQGFTYQKGQIKTPASIAKLYSATMGLSYLGPQFQFPVEVRWRQQGSDPSIISNLTLISDGTPDFSVDQLVKQLKRKGVKKVLGEIIIQSPVALPKPQDMSQVKDSGYCYNARPNALNFNRNCVSLTVTAQGVQSSDPDLDVAFKTRLKMGASYNGTRPHFKWLDRDKTDFEYVIDVSLKNNSASARVDVVVPDTEFWMVNKIVRRGEKSGLRFDESENPSFSKQSGFILGSIPVADIACTSLTESVNVYAQILFENVNRGQRSDFMKSFGVSLVEGSGMSRKNQAPGASTLKLLQSVSQSSFYGEVKNCLPAPGQKGTLEKRLESLKGKVMAKTGSLSGMTHLAGYIHSPNQRRWIPFVFMFEKKGQSVRELRRIQDQALVTIYPAL